MNTRHPLFWLVATLVGDGLAFLAGLGVAAWRERVHERRKAAAVAAWRDDEQHDGGDPS